MDLAQALDGELPRLHLPTTSTAHAASAAAVLGPDGRAVDVALERLTAAALSGADKSTRMAR